MPHGVPLWPLLLCFHLASTQVIANTRQLVSLLSEQFLTIKGKLSKDQKVSVCRDGKKSHGRLIRCLHVSVVGCF